MPVTYRDQEIESLMQERKVLPADWQRRTQWVPKHGHKERQLDFTSVNGTDFRLILRQSAINALDFSIILAVRKPQSNQLLRLRHYNGRSHEHTNFIEGQTFHTFHIHFATER